MRYRKQGKTRRKREIENVAGMVVIDKAAYFNHYLEAQVGARWHLIKRTLYDAGYTTVAVNEYRNGLLADFRAVCKEHGIIGWI